MRIIADFHIHSRYSLATSRDMTIPVIAKWARIKGIDLVGTGDFTHPAHLAAIKENLQPEGNGLLIQKKREKGEREVRFLLTAEIANIFKAGGKVRKVHSLIFTPRIELAEKINHILSSRGNITSNGRPILGCSVRELLKMVLDVSPDCMFIPAHIWTPWFSMFGSKSGFDSIEECFGEDSAHIHAVETGLSSNPQMNWRLSGLDDVTLVSNSDAHSPAKIGREANVFDCDPDYHEIIDIMKGRGRKKFISTIEFFPQEGKYYYDGHRSCDIMFSPEETINAGQICPVCRKKVTVGVMNRVSELADRPDGYVPKNAVPAIHVVPLHDIISQVFDKRVSAKSVIDEYERLTSCGKTEFDILLDMDEQELFMLAGDRIADAILRVRRGEFTIIPGFDGKFGKVDLKGSPDTQVRFS